jgi:hypothetical protein
LRNNDQSPTCTEAVGIFQWSLSLSPRCANKRALCLDVLRWALRFKIQDKFPQMIKVMHAWIDFVLLETYLAQRKTGVDLKTFLNLNFSIMGLVTSLPELRDLINEETDYANVKTQVHNVISGSRVGSSMWSFAAAKLLVHDVLEIIEKHLKAMETQHLTNVIVLQTKKDITGEIHELENSCFIPGRRQVCLRYRNFDIPNVKFSSLAQEINTKVAARIKSIAVEKGLLPPLWCEDLLPVAATVPAPAGLDADLIAGASVARQQVQKAIADGAGQDNDVVKDILNKRLKDFKGLDPDFDVEIAILQAVCNDSEGLMLKQALMTTMPSASAHRAPTDTLRLLSTLVKQPVYKMSSRELQGKVGALQKSLTIMSESRPPDLTHLKLDKFLNECAQSFDYFLRAETDNHQVLFGSSAMALKFEALVAKHTQGNVSLGDVEGINAYDWLLSKEQQVMVSTILVGVSAGKSALASSKTSTASSSKKVKTNDLDSAGAKAMSLFVKK